MADHMSAAGAVRLAKRLKAYWDKKGHKRVRFWTEDMMVSKSSKSGKDERVAITVVRSNLINGLPPIGASLA